MVDTGNPAPGAPVDLGTKADIEVRLAIADYFIKQVAGTPEGRAAFDAIVWKFRDRYPHHKKLTEILCQEFESVWDAIAESPEEAEKLKAWSKEQAGERLAGAQEDSSDFLAERDQPAAQEREDFD